MDTHHSGKDFQVLEALAGDATITQRQLAAHTGISLGKVNYVLRRLLEKGLIKVDNFRKSPNKAGYVYTLTPSGLETKSRLAVRFVVARLKEFRSLKGQLVVRLHRLHEQKRRNIVFIGPGIVHEFIEEIVRIEGLPIRVLGHWVDTHPLTDCDHRDIDAVLLFDADARSIDAIVRDTGIPREKLVRFW